MKKTYGIIMAGGGGTRFWPVSRQKKPKQLLNLSGKDLMINETIDRLRRVVNLEDIFIITNSSQAEEMMEVTQNRILKDHILVEPSARNTAACIGYAAMEIEKKYGDGIMIVAPSDAYIKNVDKYVEVLEQAVEAVERENKLVTIGIMPTFPATGYGYIKFEKTENTAVKTVTEFKEKPDEERAKYYISTGNYVWNSGIFIWKASTILKKYKKYIPDIYAELIKIGEAINTENDLETIRAIYPEIRKISVDYAIMEPSAMEGEVLVIPGEFGWSDVGSWDMMNVLRETDSQGNIAFGDTVMIDTSNTIVYSSGKLVSVVGVDNLVVVETDDAIMVCKKENAQDVKKIVEKLEASGRTEFL